MVTLKIDRIGDGLQVRIEGAAPEALSLWSCPSGACACVDACECEQEGEAVVLRLAPRAGETLSIAGIGECLRYMLDNPGRTASR